MSRKIRVMEYHPSNPKIDLLTRDPVTKALTYHGSTKWFTRVKDAVEHHSKRISDPTLFGVIDKRR